MVSPRVSVIMATYNRSNIIAHSIASLRASTMPDWELIVVGDACTDDTAAVVESFGDPRINFTNLVRNFGEQSGPNNAGVASARGEYIAFLNHDDLWFPDHLANSLDVLEGQGADLVFGIGLAISAENAPPTLVGASSSHRTYHPLQEVPASLWVFRRALSEKIGPWRLARDLRIVPSQDWLLRAHKSGARLLASPHLTAVHVSSVASDNAYRDRLEKAQLHFARRLQQPDFPIAELIAAYRPLKDRQMTLNPLAVFFEALRVAVRKLLLVLGVVPPALSHWLRYARKGAYLRSLRKRRGLPPDF